MIEAQQGELNRILNEFDEVVIEKLSQTNATCHVMDTDQSPLGQSYLYRIAPAWKEELYGDIKQLLDLGILEPSHSPWSAPMGSIRKTNCSLQLCIDYCKLNQVTVGDPYQIPRVDDQLDKVAVDTWLSKIDIKKGFYQVPVQKESQHKPSFCIPWVKYAFTRMPLG